MKGPKSHREPDSILNSSHGKEQDLISHWGWGRRSRSVLRGNFRLRRHSRFLTPMPVFLIRRGAPPSFAADAGAFAPSLGGASIGVRGRREGFGRLPHGIASPARHMQRDHRLLPGASVALLREGPVTVCRPTNPAGGIRQPERADRGEVHGTAARVPASHDATSGQRRYFPSWRPHGPDPIAATC